MEIHSLSCGFTCGYARERGEGGKKERVREREVHMKLSRNVNFKLVSQTVNNKEKDLLITERERTCYINVG